MSRLCPLDDPSFTNYCAPYFYRLVTVKKILIGRLIFNILRSGVFSFVLTGEDKRIKRRGKLKIASQIMYLNIN